MGNMVGYRSHIVVKCFAGEGREEKVEIDSYHLSSINFNK